MRALHSTLLLLLMVGCATTTITPEYNSAGVRTFIQEAANDSWLYAQLSSNAYGSSEFRSELIEKDCDLQLEHALKTSDCSIQFKSGFKAMVYRVNRDNQAEKVVIAYAGTDPDTLRNTLVDILIGTLHPRHPQYKQGLKLFDLVRQKYPRRELVTTGHSLGGAIASYVSIKRRVDAYVFNSSVVLPLYVTVQSIFQKNRISSVSQYAEVLAAMRKALPDPKSTYTTLGCVSDGAIGRHAMRALAECLTYVAAWDPAQPQAMHSLKLNGLLPIRRIDPATHTLAL